MGMTMSQKILAAHAGVESVKPGQLIMADLGLCLGNDITTPVAINEFEKAGFDAVFDEDKIALVMDHFAPNKDIKAAEQCKQCRQFAAKHKITHYYDVGCMGVEHALLPEQGLVTAGELVIGADSHTCTYGALGAFSTGVGSTDLAAGIARGKAWFKVPEAIKFVLTGKKNPWVSGKDIILHIIGLIGVDGALYQSMEFTGDGLAQLSIDDRLCMANMAIEAGAKNGIFEVDEITLAYLKEREKKAPTVYRADDNAEYSQVFEIDLAAVQPTVALPHLPENTKTVAELGEVPIDQVVIGSCTNGRLEDMAVGGPNFQGKKGGPGPRGLIFSAPPPGFKKSFQLGHLETFIDAGCAVSTPTCGPCLGGYMGILADGERCLATTNRNFVGRMGHTGSEVYLASPAVAAASALTGRISVPNIKPEEVE